MYLVRCDINTCLKELPCDQVNTVEFFGLTYDLCPECMKSFQEFVRIRLNAGRTNLKQNDLQGIQIVKPHIPSLYGTGTGTIPNDSTWTIHNNSTVIPVPSTLPIPTSLEAIFEQMEKVAKDTLNKGNTAYETITS